jgi:hypothetical protein
MPKVEHVRPVLPNAENRGRRGIWKDFGWVIEAAERDSIIDKCNSAIPEDDPDTTRLGKVGITRPGTAQSAEVTDGMNERAVERLATAARPILDNDN